MRNKTLMMAAPLVLFFLAVPQTAQAQKEGGAHAVIYDANNRPTLKFTNKSAKEQGCGALVSYTLMGNQEEAIAARVSHLHVGSLGVRPSLPESGWLYITPTRIVFSVEEGDQSHAFDLPRTKLKNEAATSLGSRFQMSDYVGMRINLKEKLPASESDIQKFVFSIVSFDRVKRCYVVNSDPYSRFLKRAVNDFDGAVAEFKQIAESLKQSGRSQQTSTYLVPPLDAANRVAIPEGNTATPGAPAASPEPGPESSGGAGVDITSEPAGAEIYIDGRHHGSTPSKIPLGVGEHTVKVTKPGYKDWERKFIVERGGVKTFSAILEKR